MGDCLQTGNRINNTKVNSAFHPFEVGKLSTDVCLVGSIQDVFTCVDWQVTPHESIQRQVTLSDPIWQVTLRSSAMGFPQKAVHRF